MSVSDLIAELARRGLSVTLNNTSGDVITPADLVKALGKHGCVISDISLLENAKLDQFEVEVGRITFSSITGFENGNTMKEVVVEGIEIATAHEGSGDSGTRSYDFRLFATRQGLMLSEKSSASYQGESVWGTLCPISWANLQPGGTVKDVGRLLGICRPITLEEYLREGPESEEEDSLEGDSDR